MATSQRLSRGFHRIGVFLGTALFLVGAAIAIFVATDQARSEREHHEQLVCAFEKRPATLDIDGVGKVEVQGFLNASPEKQEQVVRKIAARERARQDAREPNSGGPFDDLIPTPKFHVYGEPVELDLHELGCKPWSETITVQAAKDERDRSFSYPLAFARYLAIGLAISLAISLAVYGIVRAIGWLIGGFAASRNRG
jgi:hypothetical protein